MSRWKASGLHLLASFLIVGGIGITSFLMWFPYGLYHLAGLDRLLLIMFALDLTAGPLLTLVIYKAGKKGLRFDLTVIALCQLAFLSYGLHALWQSRPVFLVASDVRFNLVFANEIDAEQLKLAPRPEWRRLSWTGPQLVGVRPPADEKTRQDLLLAFMSSGIDVDKMPKYYQAFETVAPDLLRQSGATYDPKIRQVVTLSRFGEGSMLIHGGTGRPIRVRR